MRFRLLDYGDVPWERLDAYADRTVFQTRAWVEFVAETQRARPAIAELRDGQAVAGYFTGLTFRRFGAKILGSSFPGWTTPYMGFNLEPGVARKAALEALEDFAFRDLRCLHFEVGDPYFCAEDGQSLGLDVEFFETYRTALAPPEAQLYKSMSENCRWSIRKAEKSGVLVEEAGPDGFAEDFYAQLTEVFVSKGLAPTYPLDRVQSLIRNLHPTGNLLLLRARSPEGAALATLISPALNKLAEFWATASFKSGQSLRPNEALRWYAIRYWKKRGIESFDWGGGGTWKEKYGPEHVFVPRFRKSRFRWISAMRTAAQKMAGVRQRLLGRIRRHQTSSASAPEP